MAKNKPTPPATEAPAVSTQPYYLQRAHIKDFRSIRDAKVEFKPGLNIIIGANGSGKTNFVHATSYSIDVNSDSFLVGDKSFFKFERNNADFVGIMYSKKVRLIRKLSAVQIAENFSKKEVSLFSPDARLLGQSLHDIFLNQRKKAEDYFLDFYGRQIIKINYSMPSPYFLADTVLNLVVNSSEWIPLPSDEQFYPSSFISARGALLYLFLENRLSKKKIGAAEVKSAFENIFTIWLERLINHLKRYSPIEDVRLLNPIHVYDNIANNEIIIKGLLFEFEVNKIWFQFDSLSSGTQRLFYIISEVTAVSSLRFLNYQSNSPESKIVFLEEPELGIHPDQLHKLLLFLREQSEKHQIIITTHSPQVLDMLNDDELDRITICELDEKKGTQFRKLKKTQIATAKKFMQEQGLFLSDYWRYGNLEGVN